VTLLSGSYNPVHDGHRALLAAALASTGQPGYYELSVVNADKPALPYTTILHRSQQFVGEPRLVLTRAPRFIDKAALFPDSTFVLGYDTAVRLLDPKYYGAGGVDAALQDIAQHGCRFLVVGRTDATGTFRQLRLEDIPESCRSLFVLFDEERFRRDISSSSIRAGLQRLAES
jgi:nicotinic acid mononucleotide adenylyltransferase